MKQIKTILIIILLTLSTNAGWKPLQSLDHYGPKAFTLKKGVAYVEIRKYTETYIPNAAGSGDTAKKKAVVFRMYRHPLSYFGSATKHAFQKISSKKRYGFKKGAYASLGPSSKWYYDAFMLDSTGKSWRLENIQDVVDMVKPVDSLADLSLVLWLHSNAQDLSDKKSYSAKYRKNGSGYVVREHHIAHGGGDWIYGCGDYTFEYKVNTSGKVVQKKLIKKRKVECGGE
ncbi:hypothetical protein [Sulfurovum sp. NBC37-1]|uniref:hypothetical protein n=1 Tax=Sulfurovum sp. (strain NBC37-1) TaxID=387093 RepID=UPI00015879B3|nr:hypothetical protein [Sulfurovum sp. NBC37-1]BAF72965.1 hypothetical protein SUN_2023 [Sulfurovum sp. NBC37-1]